MDEEKQTRRRRKKKKHGGIMEVVEMANMMESMTKKEREVIRALVVLMGTKKKGRAAGVGRPAGSGATRGRKKKNVEIQPQSNVQL